jgi:hypothetical protein
MSNQILKHGELLAAFLAFKIFVDRVTLNVSSDIMFLFETFVTGIAGKLLGSYRI